MEQQNNQNQLQAPPNGPHTRMSHPSSQSMRNELPNQHLGTVGRHKSSHQLHQTQQQQQQLSDSAVSEAQAGIELQRVNSVSGQPGGANTGALLGGYPNTQSAQHVNESHQQMSPQPDSSLHQGGKATSVYRMHHQPALTAGMHSEHEGWTNDERRVINQVGRNNGVGAMGDDSSRFELAHNNDHSGEGHAEDADSTYMGQYSINATEVKKNLGGQRFGLPFKVGLPLSNNDIHLNPRDAVLGSPTTSRYSAATIPHSHHHHGHHPFAAQPSHYHAGNPMYGQFGGMGPSAANGNLLHGGTFFPQGRASHGPPNFHGPHSVHGGSHHPHHHHMVGPSGFESQAQGGMLPPPYDLYDRENNADGEMMLQISEKYDGSPQHSTSFRMTSPFNQGKQLKTATAPPKDTQAYARYDQVNQLPSTPDQVPKSSVVKTIHSSKKPRQGKSNSNNLTMDDHDTKQQIRDSKAFQKEDATPAGAFEPDNSEGRRRRDTALAQQESQRARQDAEIAQGSSTKKQKRVTLQSSANREGTDKKSSPSQQQKSGSSGIQVATESPDKEQNMRSQSAEKNRSQTLLTTESALPLINERSDSQQRHKDLTGTPQTKQGTTHMHREDSNTERGLLQSGMKTSRQTLTHGGGSSDDRQTSYGQKNDCNRPDHVPEAPSQLKSSRRAQIPSQARMINSRSAAQQFEAPQSSFEVQKSGDLSENSNERVELRGQVGTLAQQRPNERNESCSDDSDDLQQTQQNKRSTGPQLQHSRRGRGRQERGDREVQQRRSEQMMQPSSSFFGGHLGRLPMSVESRQSGVGQGASTGRFKKPSRFETNSSQQSVYQQANQNRLRNQDSQQHQSKKQSTMELSMTSAANQVISHRHFEVSPQAAPPATNLKKGKGSEGASQHQHGHGVAPPTSSSYYDHVYFRQHYVAAAAAAAHHHPDQYFYGHPPHAAPPHFQQQLPMTPHFYRPPSAQSVMKHHQQMYGAPHSGPYQYPPMHHHPAAYGHHPDMHGYAGAPHPQGHHYPYQGVASAPSS